MLPSTSIICSSVLPFPSIYWGSRVLAASHVQFDLAEHFEKLSYRNRYYIATAHGLQCLSIPLVNGRNQRAAMGSIQISYAENWQQQHWRTIYSAYNRSPFFEYYKGTLQRLYEQHFEKLVDFNLASIHWLKKQLELNFEEQFLTSYNPNPPGVLQDLRKLSIKEQLGRKHPSYYQVFEANNGFLSNLSLLDVLFNEGRHALYYLQQLNKDSSS